MDLGLDFANGRVSGEGNDVVGAFVISGRFDSAKGECDWTKTYIGAHDVFYRGFREGKGIWGTWEILRDAPAAVSISGHAVSQRPTRKLYPLRRRCRLRHSKFRCSEPHPTENLR
jgi:hypothetical protein